MALAAVLSFILILSAGCRDRKQENTPPSGPSQEPVDIVLSHTAEPEPAESPSPAPEPYTFAWISDTQHYSKLDNGIYERMTEYLYEHADEMNLKYIIHTGDLVHVKEEEPQWIVADRAMKTIDGMPNGVCSGNHDVGSHPEDEYYDLYKKYFGSSRYEGRPWYGGNLDDNRDHFDLIEAGNTRYIFVYLGYLPRESDFEWVRNRFLEYPDRVGILCTHEYFESDLTLSEAGRTIFSELVERCPNLYMVCCGHRYNCACVPVSVSGPSGSRTVLQMINNYQATGSRRLGSANGGNGYMRFLEIDEGTGTIHYYSYSPYLDDYRYFDDPANASERLSFSPEGEDGTVPIPWK